MQTINHWHIFDHATQVAQAVCEAIVQQAQQAIHARGSFKLVLAGGSTPERIYQLLAKQSMQWDKWFIYYGDERCLPADHPERNSVMAQQALLAQVPIPKTQIFTMPTELGNIKAARQYQHCISTAVPFDLVLLGMGEDGHTASLFPGQEHPANEMVHAVFNSPKPPPERITLSAAALSEARQVIFIITGVSKQTAVQQWREGVPLPVSLIAPEQGIEVYSDAAAVN